MKVKQFVSFIITPLVVLYILFNVQLDPANPKVTYTFCVALLMAVWWITEAVPLAITSLLPVALFPLLGIMDGKAVSATYFNDVIFLFMGGFLVALAMERWNLHKRIAIKILNFTGVSPGLILFGFMSSSFLISMWISNTATVMMMIPIVSSIIVEIESLSPGKSTKRFSIGLLLGVAYSASTGGMATLVGTPPNLSFIRIFHIYFPDMPEITFSSWLFFALPVSFIITVFIWVLLFYKYRPVSNEWNAVDRSIFKKQLDNLGKTTSEEKIVFTVFVTLALLWIFRADINFGSLTLKGWATLFGQSKYINDGTVAIFMSIILFLIPSKNEKGKKLMDWETASKLPWNILLLFGGGFALATGFKESGLSEWFGGQLSGLTRLHPILIILAISLVITFLTELTSNTATTEMILPILAGISISSGINPLLLMIPATMSASMAFMLPVATPPNAIIFGTGKIQTREMASTGLIINIVGAFIITLMMYFWGSFVFF